MLHLCLRQRGQPLIINMTSHLKMHIGWGVKPDSGMSVVGVAGRREAHKKIFGMREPPEPFRERGQILQGFEPDF
jgi:hypothetical protein